MNPAIEARPSFSLLPGNFHFNLDKSTKIAFARGAILALNAMEVAAVINFFYQAYQNPSLLNPWSENAWGDWNILIHKPSSILPFSAGSYSFSPLYQASRWFVGIQIISSVLKEVIRLKEKQAEAGKQPAIPADHPSDYKASEPRTSGL